jgi:ABC-type glycerol-3-phosphate transport system substrate-binding protein
MALVWFAAGVFACSEDVPRARVVTFPGSSVGAEARVLQEQIARFMREHPDIVVVQQRTPDAADQRHQLYVQWLNARARDPDVLQLDVVWTPEFAAAGWLLPLTRFAPDTRDFFAATLEASRYRGPLYALPWFVDVGMLYYRTDVLSGPPETQAELVAHAQRAQRAGMRSGLVWQGARYEGLVAVFSEYLAAHGGEILDREGRAALRTRPARAALEAMHAALYGQGIVPRAVLSWQEEHARFAFQNGQALFMRNWPYAYAVMQQPGSQVAGRFAVSALPPAPAGRSASTLGGSQLAINARSDAPEAAYALIAFLTAPAQMLERARVVGQFPPRRSLYATPELERALAIPPARVQRIIDSAIVRPVTPVYAELSDILQVHLHRCLSNQESVDEALLRANREIDALLVRVGLARSSELRGNHDG